MSSGLETKKSPEKGSEFESHSHEIMKTTSERSKRTRELLSQLLPKEDPEEIIQKAIIEANNKNKNIKIEAPKPGEYLTKAVLELQYKFLGFPKDDIPTGCDGKLGEYTLRKLRENLPLLDKYLTEKESKVTRSRSALTGLKGELLPASSDSKTASKPTASADIYQELPVASEKLPPTEVQYRNTKSMRAIREDHEQNLEKLKIMDSKLNQIKRFIDIAKQNQRRYEFVSERTGIPWELIAALHYRESGMKFNTYLHNGQKLGKPTTIVPKGIMFAEDEWELAAIHALGGELSQEELRGNKPEKYSRNVRKSLGIDKNTQDLSKLFAFAETFNGLAYRAKGVPTPYVYSGTNMYDKGLFYADFKYSPDRQDRSVGVAALVIALKKAV